MPFDAQPMPRGRCLTVRPLCPADFEGLYAVARDPLVWAQHPARDRYRLEVFQQFFAMRSSPGERW